MKNISLFIVTTIVMLTGLFSVVNAEVYVWLDGDGIRHISNVKPEWWTDEMDKQDPGSVIAPEDGIAMLGKFIGDRENKKFHWPLCIQIYNPQNELAIPMEKRIWFKSYQEAIDQNYVVCDHCQPSADGPEYKPPQK